MEGHRYGPLLPTRHDDDDDEDHRSACGSALPVALIPENNKKPIRR